MFFPFFRVEGDVSVNWITPNNQEFSHARKDAMQYGLLKLASRPNLNVVPEERQALVARICALLSRKPSAGRLIPLVLAARESEVFENIGSLMQHGHVVVASPQFAHGEPQAAPQPAVKPAAAAHVERRSLVAKLWARLTTPA